MANWLRLYSFDDNMERTVKILKKFDITNYHFVMGNGLLALLISVGLNSYRIEIDEVKKEVVVRKKQVRRREKIHAKEYMRIVASFNNDGLYSSIKWVWEDSKI